MLGWSLHLVAVPLVLAPWQCGDVSDACRFVPIVACQDTVHRERLSLLSTLLSFLDQYADMI